MDRHSDNRPVRRTGAQRSRASQDRRTRQGGRAPVRRYSRQEIRHNRIIAVVVLVVLIALIVSLVSCAARALGGSRPADDASSGASVSVSSTAAAAASADAPSAEAPSAASSDGGSAASPPASASTAAVAEISQRAVQRKAAATAPAYQGVEDPWVPGGRFTTGDEELDQFIKEYCDSNSTEGASAAENARNAFMRTTWVDFEERDNNQYPEGPNWDIEYAKQFFYENSGNCFEVVAVDEFVLKYFGYTEAYAEPCYILRQSGEYGDHGLLYVTDFDGRKCLCDVAFGANGWMLDADIYTVKLIDIGQDKSEHSIANFEEVIPAPWSVA